jgi:phage gpG-like protein
MRARAVRGLTAAAVHLTKRLKEVLSSPAPRTRVTARSGALAGSVYYRATSPATPGAPPRKLTGRLRASVSYLVDAAGLRARVGTNVIDGAVHEHGNHPWLLPTLAAERSALLQLVARSMATPAR